MTVLTDAKYFGRSFLDFCLEILNGYINVYLKGVLRLVLVQIKH